jgi:PAS domain S-box-containing protein
MQTKSNGGKGEELFISLADRMLDGVIILGWDGTVLYANEAASRMAGMETPEEGVGLNMMDFIHPDSRESVINDLRLINEGKRGFHADYRLYKLKTLQGEVRWVEAIGTKVNYGGKTADMVTLRDITQRKQTEEMLERERKAFSIITETSLMELDIHSLCYHILSDLVETLEFDTGIIRLYNNNDKKLHVTATFGLNDEESREKFVPTPLDDPKDITAFVARTGEAIFAPDIREHEIMKTHAPRISELGVSATISWPMFGSEQNLLGVVHLLSKTPKNIEENDRRFFETVAVMFAVVLERKQINAELKEAEEKYRSIFENAKEGIFQLTSDLRLIDANPALAHIHGFESLEELMSETETLPTRLNMDSEHGSELTRHLSEKGYVKELEVKGRRKDGRQHWISLNAHAVRDREGKFLYYEGTARGITKRKKAEEALQESEKMYRTIFETTGTATIIIEEDTIISLANKEFIKLTGYSREELEEKMSWTQCVVPEDLEKMKKYHKLRRTKTGVAPRSCEYKLIDKHGNIKDISLIVNMIPGTKKSVVSSIDVTERKKAEKALKESEEQYRSMINAMGDAIIVVDKNLHTVLINKACIQACKRFGLETEILGKHIFDAFPFFTEKALEEISQIFAGDTFSVTEEDYNINGRKIVAEVRKIPVYENDMVARVMIIIRNITDKKQAEIMLKESEERYKSLTEDAPIGLCNIDTKGIITYVNRRSVEITGYSPDELIGKSGLDLELFDSETLRILSKRLKERLEGDIPYPFETQIVCKDGTQKWLELTSREIEEDHTTTGFQVAVRDITDRKMAEVQLRKSEDAYRRLFNNAADLIAVIDTKGTFQDLNDKFEEESGYAREEMLGKNVFTSGILSVESTTRLMSYLPYRNQLLSRKHSPIFEVEGVMKSGTIIPYELRAVPIMKDGMITSIQAILRNISDRRQAEQDLMESEQKFRELAELLPDTIYETDLQGNFTFVNRNGFRQFGYTQEDFENGLNVLDMLDPVVRKRAMDNRKKVMNGENLGLNEYTALRKDGSTFPVMIHSSPIIRGEKLAGIRGFLIDITEQRQAEKEKKRLEVQLQRARKMEALGTLAGGVAHDLNNVLGGLVSYPELLLLQLSEDDPLRKPISIVKKSGEKAAAIVQDLLTLARRGVSAREDIDLNRIIHDHFKTPEHERLLQFHPDVEVEKHLEKYLLNIQGSPIHLSKTVMNLLSNAAEAMPDGGKIIISTENRYIDRPVRGYDNVKEGDYVVLTVTDNGIGISSKDLEQIFEPFYTKKVMGRSGTGLGMAVVWGTVKDHKGYIDIESSEGEGTTITLYFPARRKRLTRDKNLQHKKDYQGKGETILIVDDVREQREIAIQLLEKLGYTAIAVASGEEAIDYINKHSIDLVMLDMIMDPGIDGFETYTRMIEINPGQKTIIVSGFSETRRVKKLQKLGAGDYVKKPYLMETIGTAIRKELDKE